MIQRVMEQDAYEALLHNLGECWMLGKQRASKQRLFTYNNLLDFFVRS